MIKCHEVNSKLAAHSHAHINGANFTLAVFILALYELPAETQNQHHTKSSRCTVYAPVHALVVKLVKATTICT